MNLVEQINRARNLSRILSRRDAFRLAFAAPADEARAFAAPSLGAPLYLRPGGVDVAVLEKVFLARDYELPFALSPRRIVDAGAHIGLASRFFAQRHPGSRIVAIEPIEANLAVLRHNAESFPQIEIRAAALWSHVATLSSAGESSWSHIVSETADGAGPIRSLTIPEILAETGWETIDLLKLDIEGAEREIFSDHAAEWLPRVRAIVLELHDRIRPGCSAAFYRQIADRLETHEVRGENVFVLLRPD